MPFGPTTLPTREGVHELPGFKVHRLTLGRALPATTSVGGSKQAWRARPPRHLWSRLSLLGETPAPAHSASPRAPLIGVRTPSARFWVEKVANPHVPYTTQSRNHQPTPRHQTPPWAERGPVRLVTGRGHQQ